MNVLSDFVARVEDMEKMRNIAGNKITEEREKSGKKETDSSCKKCGECCEGDEKGEY